MASSSLPKELEQELEGAEEVACYNPVCTLNELQELGRKRVISNGRAVVVFYVQDTGNVYALDHFCYHSGGPLDMGDIEDCHGRLCVICPWHKHSITLDTGESLYTAVDPSNLTNVTHNMSKGVKQRTHEVKVEGSQVFLKLSSTGAKPEPALESDRYYTEQYQSLTESVLTEPTLGAAEHWRRYNCRLPAGKSL